MILLALALVGLIALTWQPSTRIESVSVTPAEPRYLAVIEEALAGTYFGLIPKNSAFFVPEHLIRTKLIQADGSIRAVSVKTERIVHLMVELHVRVPVALWCGLAHTPDVAEYCYLFDADGLVYAAADTSSTTPLNHFSIYDSLSGAAEEPLGAKLAHAADMPNLFDFAREVGSLGSQTVRVTLFEDEAELTLSSGTRLRYVLGNEEEAFTNLVSAEKELNLKDGSVEYIDLRFPAKLYVKRKDDTVGQ